MHKEFDNVMSTKIERLRDELVSLAGHELKNPLTAFHMQTALIKSVISNQDNQEIKEKLFTAIKSSEIQVKRMEHLLDQMIWLLENQLSNLDAD